MFKNLFRGLRFFIAMSFKIDYRYILYLFLYQIVVAVCAISLIVWPKFIIDELMGAMRLDRLIAYAAALVLIAQGGQVLKSHLVTHSFLARLRIANEYILDMHGRMAEADYACMESKDYHELKEKADKFLYCDWHGFGYVVDSAFEILGQLFTLLGIAAVLFQLSPWVLLASALLVGVDSFAAARAKQKAIALNLEQVNVERQGMYYHSLFEEKRFGKEIRLFGLKDFLLGKERAELQKMDSFYVRARRYWMRADQACALTGVLREGLGYGYLILQALRGALSIGNFTLYSGALSSFSAAMHTMLGNLVDIKQYGLYYDAMMDFLNVPRTLRENAVLPLPQGAPEIRFERVSFRYPGQSVDALSDVSLTLRPGMKLSIVGENGAGKSTFIKLLMRIYAPTSGRITLNGVDIGQIDYDAYMSLFSPVFQDFNLFAFSLKENVCFGKEADLSRLVRQSGLEKRVSTLPKGVDTPLMHELDPEGFEPSGGEGQKIALMRALFKDAPIVVLDEPAAALDPRSEYQLYRQFDAMVQGKSAVYISHRMSSARFCDEICVFEGGKIAEMGTHDQLMERHGLYADLFNMQKQYYVEE